MPVFTFESPSGTKYRIEGPSGSTKEQAAAELQRRLDSGELAQERVGTERGRGTNTGNAEYTPPKPVKKSTAETVGKYGADILLGLPKSAAKSAGEVIASNVAPIVGTVAGIGQDIATRFGDNQGDKSPMKVRQEIIDAAAPKTKTGKAVNQALSTIFYPVGKAVEYTTDMAKGAGAADIYAAAAGDIVGLYAGTKYAQGLGKAANAALEATPAVARNVAAIPSVAADIASSIAPTKIYDAAGNLVYKGVKSIDRPLRQMASAAPVGSNLRSGLSEVRRKLDTPKTAIGSVGAAGAALLYGEPIAAGAILGARALYARGAKNALRKQGEAFKTKPEDIADQAASEGMPQPNENVLSEPTPVAGLAENIKQDIQKPIEQESPVLAEAAPVEVKPEVKATPVEDVASQIKADILPAMSKAPLPPAAPPPAPPKMKPMSAAPKPAVKETADDIRVNKASTALKEAVPIEAKRYNLPTGLGYEIANIDYAGYKQHHKTAKLANQGVPLLTPSKFVKAQTSFEQAVSDAMREVDIPAAVKADYDKLIAASPAKRTAAVDLYSGLADLEAKGHDLIKMKSLFEANRPKDAGSYSFAEYLGKPALGQVKNSDAILAARLRKLGATVPRRARSVNTEGVGAELAKAKVLPSEPKPTKTEIKEAESIKEQPLNKNIEDIIYSKKEKARIKSTGEVFTPPELINEMLDKIPEDVWKDKTKTALEPAAGNGNFVIEVLKRKIELGKATPLEALKTTFAIELMPDNVIMGKHRVLQLMRKYDSNFESNKQAYIDVLNKQYKNDNTLTAPVEDSEYWAKPTDDAQITADEIRDLPILLSPESYFGFITKK